MFVCDNCHVKEFSLEGIIINKCLQKENLQSSLCLATTIQRGAENVRAIIVIFVVVTNDHLDTYTSTANFQRNVLKVARLDFSIVTPSNFKYTSQRAKT